MLPAGCAPRTQGKAAEPSAGQVRTLDPAAIDATIKSPHNSRRLERCFMERYRVGVLFREVRLIVHFVVLPDGGVGSARIAKRTVEDDLFESCVVGVFSSMTFPETGGEEVPVNYPLVFKGPA